MIVARRLAAVVLTATVLVPVACTSDDAADETASSGDALPDASEITVPETRLTPFCQAMIDLGERLATDPPDDEVGYIVSVYTDILDEVPPEIEDDFRTVLAQLEAGRAPSTAPEETSLASVPVEVAEDFDAEGQAPDTSPNARVNSYIDFSCRGSANNPGPQATQPQDRATQDS